MSVRGLVVPCSRHVVRRRRAPRTDPPRCIAQVWELRTRKLMEDLPGHADEVYTVDWSPDGERVASGGKDRNLKLWRR